jgi:hypothetical protein
MRRLGPLVVLILVIVFPGAATAAWQGGGQWDYGIYNPPESITFDRFNTGLLYLESEDTPGAGLFRNSFDGGTTWGDAGALTPGGKNFDVGVDGDGNRIWAYSLSNTIVVTRASWTEGPGDPATTRSFSVPRVSDLKLSVNAKGDALIGWSDKFGDPGVAFWEAGEDAPGSIQILPNAYYCGTSSSPTPFLDPAGSATFAWTCDGAGVNQASTDDASVPGSFGASQRLALGSIVKSGQASDGRAVLLFDRTETIPANSYGVESAKVLKYASRVAGSSFNDANVLVGGGDTNYSYMADRIVVSPSGRVLTGFSTYANIPDPGYFCEVGEAGSPYKPASSMATGTIDAESGELTFHTTVLSEPGLTGAWVTHVAVGPDGRFALAHGGTGFCGVDLRPSAREDVLISLDGENFDEIPNPYKGLWSFKAFTFNAKGQLFITARNAIVGPPHYDLYDTGAPLVPAVHGGTTGATGELESKNLQPSSIRPQMKLTGVKIRKRGRLLVTLESAVAGKFFATAAAGKRTVAAGSANAKPGTTKLQIKLNSKAAKQLKNAGKVKAKLTVTFTPDTGVAPRPITKNVTFKK